MRQKVFSIIITGVLLSSLSFGYSGGLGTAEDPYQIATKADLLELADTIADYNKCFILTADIDLEGQVFTTAVIAYDVDNENYDFDGTAFTGRFDGNGHKIIHFIINGGSNWYLGLFGHIDAGGSVKNLGLENCTVSGYCCVGGLVGRNNGNVSDCYSTGTVSGSYDSWGVGGLVGYNSNGGSISNCYSTGAVSGDWTIGGLVGCNYGSISDCYSTGTVSGSSNSYEVGGIVGENAGSISNCYSAGMVSGSSGSYDVGGLVGLNYDSISNCYSTGAVSGDTGVGGLVAVNAGSISNCYSTGSVSGSSYIGGLVGTSSGTTNASFWDVETSGQTSSAGGTGKTTTEMKTLSTFTSADWDFDYDDGDEADWFIQIDEYPILVWQISPADIYTDGRNNFRDFAIFAQYWMRDGCAIYNYYCDWADMNFNGSVDIDDLIVLMSYWLELGIYN